MSCRPAPLTVAQRAQLGQVVAAMRGAGLPWKKIAEELGLGRTHLWRCWRLYRDGMEQHRAGMEQARPCAAPLPAPSLDGGSGYATERG